MFTTHFDLTHKIHKDIPNWNGCCGYHLTIVSTIEKNLFETNEYHFNPSACGTHIDAPMHKVIGGRDIGDLEIRDLTGPLRVFDFSDICGKDKLISLNEFKELERNSQPIDQGDFCLIRTGWGQFWENPDLYRAEDSDGIKHFPAISTELATYLIDKNVLGIGTDTLSPDTGQNGFPVHDIILGAGKIIAENVKIPDDLPHQGLTAYILPPPFCGASESPVRFIAVKK